ncbi:MAG TPA: hypothetical protein VK541_09635 [Pedobacter sp.]|uniref:hypothetical protein n=1 Tax=Pedobacter sp. TaxID=1411316 RepID=UPI002BA08DDB|nr:hypothetical protein [Pedobacter sp.]HMI02732.1 hypothetical protein [Pedobacter sp.]
MKRPIPDPEFPGSGLLLSHLGVSLKVQQFFADSFHSPSNDELCFSYGTVSECFRFGFHYVPLVAKPWIAGNSNPSQISHVFLCNSAMEAVAFLALNYSSFSGMGKLLFISFGVCPAQDQVDLVRERFRHKRIALIYGGDLLGRIADVKIACWLNGKDLTVSHQMPGILKLRFQDTGYTFYEEKLTLSAFERASGFRSDVRTYKPRHFMSFLEQLLSLML